MTADTDQTQRVKVIWGEDDEPFVVDGTHDSPVPAGEGQFVVDVPKALMDAIDEAWKAYRRATHAVIEYADIDPDGEPRLNTICPTWTGSVQPERVYWNIVLSASGRDDTWPVIDVSLTHAETHLDAQAVIDGLPETFQLWNTGRLASVERTQLRVERCGWGGTTSRCYRCGHLRDEHADKGEPLDPMRRFPHAGRVSPDA